MARFTYFSRHALQRIGQRSKLTYFDIADILDFGRAVNVGDEIVFDRRHWLFYSELDACCFVAIQDFKTGQVITVLPMDYHESLAWKVTPEQCNAAISLSEKSCAPELPLENCIGNKKRTQNDPKPILQMPPTTIQIKAAYSGT